MKHDHDGTDDVRALAAAARGGRVAHSGFLDEASSARCAAALRAEGVGVAVDGGFPGAARRVVTAHPGHVPTASAPLSAVHVPGTDDAEAVRAAWRARGVPAERLGDAVRHHDGVSFVVLGDADEPLLAPLRVGRDVRHPREVPLDKTVAGNRKTVQAVVPSLRVDVLGAKALGVSRAYFGKGVAAGNVRRNGERVGKSAAAEEGDELWAEGLGRVRLLEVGGETKKGNLKVVLEVERA